MKANLTFEYPLKIRERHLDTFGHVNNSVYLEIFEEARWEIINSAKYGIPRIRETGLGPVLLEAHLKFLRELPLGALIVVKTQMVALAGKVITLRQWIEGEGGVIHCEAEFKMGLFDVRARKLVPPTEEWLRAIGAAL